MNKWVIIAVVSVAVVVAATVLYFGLTQKGKELPTSVEYVGGRYNVTLSFFNDSGQIDYGHIDYVDETGNHSEMYFEPQMRTGLDWIRNNTVENATFLCWWDYGHMVKGYAERNVIGRNPSHEWIEMVPEGWRSHVIEFDSNDKLVDVAKALTTSNSTETMQIMEKYSATYIVVYEGDMTKLGWIYRIAGVEPSTYIYQAQNSSYAPNEEGRQTMIVRLLDNRDTGFTLVYQDTVMKVYKKN